MHPTFVDCSGHLLNGRSRMSSATSSRQYKSPVIRPSRCPAMVVKVSYSDDLERADVGQFGEHLKIDGQRLLHAALRGEKAELSIFLCSDRHMCHLNQTWRNKNSTTDVLSFPQDDQFVSFYSRVNVLPCSNTRACLQELFQLTFGICC
jgi:hypothetical protein